MVGRWGLLPLDGDAVLCVTLATCCHTDGVVASPRPSSASAAACNPNANLPRVPPAPTPELMAVRFSTFSIAMVPALATCSISSLGTASRSYSAACCCCCATWGLDTWGDRVSDAAAAAAAVAAAADDDDVGV